MATPIWNEKEQRWTLRITQYGQTKKFTSSKKGLAGKKEVLKKSRFYYENGSNLRYSARVNEVWELFLSDCKARNGANSASYKNYESIGRLRLIPALGPKRVSALQKADYQNLINNAKPLNSRTEHLSKEYLRDIRSALNQFIKFAYENGYCDELRGALYIPKGHPTKGQVILQPDQVKRLFEPSELQFHKAFLFMVSCGLRPSECIGLQWDDIDNESIHIKRGINSRNFITDGKTKNARRTIPLNSLLRNILADQKKATAHLHSKWVFCDKIGDHGTQDKLRRDYDKLKEERGLVGSAYSMRHTFISLVKVSLSETVIKEIVGHSSSMPTLDIYGHPVDGELREAAQIIDLTFSNYIMKEQKK